MMRWLMIGIAVLSLSACGGKTDAISDTNTAIQITGSSSFLANANSLTANTFTVTNKDQAALTITSIQPSLSTLLVINNNCDNQALNVNASCTFQVLFDGANGNFSNASVAVNSSSGYNSTEISGSVVPSAWQLHFANGTANGYLPLGVGSTSVANGTVTLQVSPVTSVTALRANSYVLTGITRDNNNNDWDYVGGVFPGTDASNKCNLNNTIPSSGCIMQLSAGNLGLGYSDIVSLNYTLDGHAESVLTTLSFAEAYSALAVAQPQTGNSALLLQALPQDPPSGLPNSNGWENITPTSATGYDGGQITAAVFDSTNNQLLGNGEAALMLFANTQNSTQTLWYLNVNSYGVDATKWQSVTTSGITGTINRLVLAYASGDILAITPNKIYYKTYSTISDTSAWNDITPANPYEEAVDVSINNTSNSIANPRVLFLLSRNGDDSYHLLRRSLPLSVLAPWEDTNVLGQSQFDNFTPAAVFVSSTVKQADDSQSITALIGVNTTTDQVVIFTTTTAPQSIASSTVWTEHDTALPATAVNTLKAWASSTATTQDRQLLFSYINGSGASSVPKVYSLVASSDALTNISPSLSNSTGWSFLQLTPVLNTYSILVPEYQQALVVARQNSAYNDKLFWRQRTGSDWSDITPADHTTDQFTVVTTDGHF